MINVKNKDLPDNRSVSEKGCLILVKGTTAHKQGQDEPRGKEHKNYEPRSKSDFDPFAYGLSLFFLCKRLILWYKNK
ncbi:MAG: hypothetical protein P8075_11995 [Deltaproteobacteria bacterium]|jgi:hypothetical protein